MIQKLLNIATETLAGIRALDKLEAQQKIIDELKTTINEYRDAFRNLMGNSLDRPYQDRLNIGWLVWQMSSFRGLQKRISELENELESERIKCNDMRAKLTVADEEITKLTNRVDWLTRNTTVYPKGRAY